MDKVIMNDIAKLMEEIAPLKYAADFDNPGFLVGDKNAEVTGIVITLDCNEETILFAKENNCNLIISHHPLIFHPVKSVTTDTAVGKTVYELIKNGVSLYSAHTNFDRADNGTDDVLAEKIGYLSSERLEDVTLDGKAIGFGRIGTLGGITVAELKKRIEETVGGVVITTASEEKIINVAASCAGSGGDLASVAIEKKAEIFITGEMSYHEALDAKRLGMDVMLTSHQTSEQISLNTLKNTLQNHLKGVKYNIRVILAPFSPFWH